MMPIPRDHHHRLDRSKYVSRRKRYRDKTIYLLVCSMLVTAGTCSADDQTETYIEPPITAEDFDHWSLQPLTATRFCLSGPDMPDINLMKERRHTVLNEITATVGEVVLGMQIGCAQCHDHKSDPISQADFYRFRAIFEPAVQLERDKSLSFMSEKRPYQGSSHLMLRGDFRRLGMKLSPDVIRAANRAQIPFAPQPTNTTEGRRTALAEWLVSSRNPLTARVIANRIWQHHFGRGLVETPSDFGVMGTSPSNPLLLDWLAMFLIDQDWSLKSLHRKIVTSATYRQRSFLDPEATRSDRDAWNAAMHADPDARLLSRYPRRRLDGEAILEPKPIAVARFARSSLLVTVQLQRVRDCRLKGQFDRLRSMTREFQLPTYRGEPPIRSGSAKICFPVSDLRCPFPTPPA